jgi:hypothetical protein
VQQNLLFYQHSSDLWACVLVLRFLGDLLTVISLRGPCVQLLPSQSHATANLLLLCFLDEAAGKLGWCQHSQQLWRASGRWFSAWKAVRFGMVRVSGCWVPHHSTSQRSCGYGRTWRSCHRAGAPAGGFPQHLLVLQPLFVHVKFLVHYMRCG